MPSLVPSVPVEFDIFTGKILGEEKLCGWCKVPTTWAIPRVRLALCPRCQGKLLDRYNTIVSHGLGQLTPHICVNCKDGFFCPTCPEEVTDSCPVSFEIGLLYCLRCSSSPEEGKRMYVRMPGDPIPGCRCNRCKDGEEETTW